MILKQFYLACLSHASYFIADERTGSAVVIDPQRDIEQYIEEAARLRVRIEHVILTHFHADFVAGHLELSRRTGARIYLGRRARAQYDMTPLGDGDTIELGDVRLKVLETPGHTPEGISILVYDLKADAREPHAVLTGDTLFIGDVGRPDLMASAGVSAAELAGWMYDSLHEKLLKLPDATLVYPAHGAGSMCGKNLSSETVSTIGDQRRLNYALQPMTKAEFVKLVSSDLPPAPAYFAHDAALNGQRRATLDEVLERALKPLSFDRVLELARSGAEIVDVRKSSDFANAHLAGSINLGLEGKFASWAGSLLDLSKEVVIVADPGREREAALRLGRVGIDRIAGFLEGGGAEIAKHPEHARRMQRTTPQELSERLARGERVRVLDVRTPDEWKSAHIEGSSNVPLIQLAERIRDVPQGSDVAVICKSGYRSSCATSLLEKHGFKQLIDVAGGMDAWHSKKLPALAGST